jgi:hypothetical protein
MVCCVIRLENKVLLLEKRSTAVANYSCLRDSDEMVFSVAHGRLTGSGRGEQSGDALFEGIFRRNEDVIYAP